MALESIDFKKREPKKDDISPIPRGTVVTLNGDTEGVFMTVSDYRRGQVYARWHSDGILNGDWFWPEELDIQDENATVKFQAEFTQEE
jgi:hypothetical protein